MSMCVGHACELNGRTCVGKVDWVYSLNVYVLSVNVCWVCLLYMHVEYIHVEFVSLSDAFVEYAC